MPRHVHVCSSPTVSSLSPLMLLVAVPGQGLQGRTEGLQVRISWYDEEIKEKQQKEGLYIYNILFLLKSNPSWKQVEVILQDMNSLLRVAKTGQSAKWSKPATPSYVQSGQNWPPPPMCKAVKTGHPLLCAKWSKPATPSYVQSSQNRPTPPMCKAVKTGHPLLCAKQSKPATPSYVQSSQNWPVKTRQNFHFPDQILLLH